jgi:hypothetical protein
MSEQYVPIEQWGEEFNVDKLLRDVWCHMDALLPDTIKEIKEHEDMTDKTLKDLKRLITISLREWYLENTEE